MRLKPEEIDRISKKLLNNWKQKQLFVSSKPDHLILDVVLKTITSELRLEEDLNQEVENVLSQYEKKFESGELDRRKMFQMVKTQLAKEKKIVL